MIHRNSSFPIFSTVLISLAAYLPLPAQTQFEGADGTTAPVIDASTASTVLHGKTYTVVRGDSLMSIAAKFNTTRKKLQKLNSLASLKVKPGQVLEITAAKIPKVPKSAMAKVATPAKRHHVYPTAQPVQAFDTATSAYGPGPAPTLSRSETAESLAPVKHAPIAQLVPPDEFAAAEQQQENAAPVVEKTPPTPVSSKHFAQAVSTASPMGTSAPVTTSRPVPKSSNHTFGSLFGSNSLTRLAPANDWASRFLYQARLLGNEGLGYDDDWRPPGESHPWAMDCSNTARYLYKVTTGIQLPRTASDQYYYLHLQGKAWDVPQTTAGWADGNFLRRNLKPGDLLFWENTYRPERQPPITHVMVFLGTNAKGEWIMAGSQSSRGGEHNRRHGGPDIYVFRPSQPCGGYTTWLGLVRHQGRFCAFGRPLDADPSKLATND